MKWYMYNAKRIFALLPTPCNKDCGFAFWLTHMMRISRKGHTDEYVCLDCYNK